MQKRTLAVLLGITLTSLMLMGCDRATPTPTATLTLPPPTATATSTPLPTATFSPTPSPMPALTPTFTPVPLNLTIWVQDDTAEQNRVAYVRDLADAYVQPYAHVGMDVVSKTRAELRRLIPDETSAFPDLLWAEHEFVPAGVAAHRLAELEEVIDMAPYLDTAITAAIVGEHVRGVPVASGNFLQLYYNKQFVPSAPPDTAALISATNEVITGGVAGLVFPPNEPLWLVPWLHGFGGELFETPAFSPTLTALTALTDRAEFSPAWADLAALTERAATAFPYWTAPLTPTLHTPQMVETLQMLHDWRFVHRITPGAYDYETADRLFRERRAALIINGDWAMAAYEEALGADLGVAPLPAVPGRGLPRPYIANTYLMVGRHIPLARAELARGFIRFATNQENQIALAQRLGLLPLTKAALTAPLIAQDPRWQAEIAQMRAGIPFPSSPEMRCLWDAMRPELSAVLKNGKTPKQAAQAMQNAAEACLAFGR